MKPILNLNKHPKNCENLSLVYAKNVRLSNDGASLQSEEAFIDKEIINRTLLDKYLGGYKYIAFIPCNKELIIFVADTTLITEDTNYPIDIWRYNEELDQTKLVYKQYDYHQGTIKGDFTYNVHNDLIIAIAESDGIKDVPLKTINLGKFEEDKEQLSNQLLPINPEVYIPTLSNYDYVVGNIPKGWYYIFVRYKINNIDYTKWFDVSSNILVNNIEKQSIFKLYGYKKNEKDEPFSTGALDYFSTNEEISNETLKLTFSYLDNRYKNYQIGFICNNKSNTISYISSDIKIDNNIFLINIDEMFEYDYKEFIIDNYNPYNVKNIINYNNRLYIGNYKEKLLEDYDTSNIQLNLINDFSEYDDVKYITYTGISSDNKNYRTVGKEIDYIETNYENDDAVAVIYPNLIINSIKYNTLIDTNAEFINLYGGSDTYTINESKNKNKWKYENGNVIIQDSFRILTKNNNILIIYFYANFSTYITNISPIIEFSYIVGNNTYKTFGTPITYNSNHLQFKINNGGQITAQILIPKNINIENELVKNINTKNSFNNRRKTTSLIPGEIYNFYIHFVDKYGFETKGFKINSNSITNKLNAGTYNGFVPILINYTLDGLLFKYAFMKPNMKMFDETGNIKIDTSSCCSLTNYIIIKNYNETIDTVGVCLTNYDILKERLTELYGNFKNNFDITWEDVAINNIKGIIFNTKDDYDNWDFNENDLIEIPIYLDYYNKNGEKYFKIPYVPIKSEIVNGKIFYSYPNIKIDIKNVNIPKGYIGYFVSYEKLEENSKITGILTKYDFNDKDYTENNKLTNYNKSIGNKMYFYCSDFDILDKVNLKYNTLRLENKNNIFSSKNLNVILNSIIENVSNLNVIEEAVDESFDVKYIGIDEYNILIGNDPIKNRFGLGTCLELPLDEELFPDDNYNLYKASLLFINDSIYSSKDKILIKCTNIIYPEINQSENIIQYLNGRHTYDGFIMYDNNKFIYSDGENKVYGENDKEYIGYDTDISLNAKLLAYIQIPTFKEYFNETKSFKNKPTAINFKINSKDTEINIQLGLIVKPLNSIDLFENKFTNPNNYIPKYYTNNRTDIEYITQFNKFIRRSDLIQDESSSNSWRKFGLENYKVISENKGKITNIIGIGHYLLVHTEHSLFAFNSNNTLKTLNEEIQLKIPDIFDVDYRELVTSDLGFAGLQDNDAYCIDNFGYIFYDNDSNRIFRFDEGKLDYIDTDIVQWLNKYKPNQIRFAVDKKSNRILCTINIDDVTTNHDVILSYNYGIDKFISFHEYVIKQAVNTKNELYLVDELGKINVFNYNSLLQDNYSKNECELQIVINDTYDRIKFLEYIIYRLFAFNFTNKDIDADSHIYPVEEMLKPYSGIFIRVYNDEVDTGWLDCQISSEEDKNKFTNYKLPYWNKGNWNFSYLRDKINKMRLYGNYFIVCFKFGGTEYRCEFESLGYFISKDRRNG